MAVSDIIAQKYGDRISQLEQIHTMLRDKKHNVKQHHKLRDTERLLRRDLTWRLSVEQGMTQQQSAELLGYSQPTISRDYKLVVSDIQKGLEEEAQCETALQIEQLKHMISELREAWEISCGTEKIVTSTKRKGNDDDETIVTTTRVKLREGNVRYFREIRDCMSDIRDILGIDAPIRSDITSGGMPLDTDSITIIVRD